MTQYLEINNLLWYKIQVYKGGVVALSGLSWLVWMSSYLIVKTLFFSAIAGRVRAIPESASSSSLRGGYWTSYLCSECCRRGCSGPGTSFFALPLSPPAFDLLGPIFSLEMSSILAFPLDLSVLERSVKDNLRSRDREFSFWSVVDFLRVLFCLPTCNNNNFLHIGGVS